MWDLMTASDILALTKPHISEYSCFRLFLRSEAKRCCAATASIPGTTSADYTIGLKVCLCSRQGWRYLSLFSFYAVSRAFTYVWCRQDPTYKLKNFMLKREEVLHFQKPWTATSALDSSCTVVCPVSPGTILDLRNRSQFLSPCMVLLVIFGL